MTVDCNRVLTTVLKYLSKGDGLLINAANLCYIYI